MQGASINRLKLWHDSYEWQTVFNNAPENRKYGK